MNPINERIHAVGVWESLTMRKAGPLALVDQLCALPGPPLRFSPGWQNRWAFGPRSQIIGQNTCVSMTDSCLVIDA
jgi:hypothetical protein